MDNKEKLDFVSYNIALTLQTLGFDKKCFAKIDQTEYIQIKGEKSGPRGAMMYDIVDCPLYSQAFKWFREEHNLPSHIYTGDTKFYHYAILDEGRYVHQNMIVNVTFLTYEEAELNCLLHLIKILIDKNYKNNK